MFCNLIKFPLFVSEQGLDNLQYYKYSGVDLSLMVNYFLGPYFWNLLIEKFPMWLAPNMITLAGGLFMGMAMIVMNIFLDPNSEPNILVNTFVCIMIFLYQTADNLDGKQARRTKSSSPLGELFDHGVDSIMIGIFSVAVVLNLHLTTTKCYLLMMVLNTVFYMSHWEEYHVGTLVLGYIMNPTELQYLTIGFLLFQGFFPKVGETVILMVSINDMIYYFILICCILGCFKYYLNVSHWSQKNNTNLSSAILCMTQYFIFLILTLLLVLLLQINLNQSYKVFWINCYIIILINAYLTQRLVVKRICKEPISMMDNIFYGYGLYIIILFIVLILHNESLAFLTTIGGLIFAFFMESLLIGDICYAFSRHLGIHVLTISPIEENDV
ncbi:hypothetical protein ENUP19_0228G0015 [Entamoeba nuttalli]|uniref:CDP-alcohol phosphatidyltransferase family protein n=2 Tax=Entamoeba nuttalli TaxID=412467 RepID=K2G692_ENTNP|nr:CDP-alcohol phosphatidyltransferase family protein [Entamoeba nuttalli P19]EKE37926.1 CDP-alcohol phosphatidyltransferase family protein [Entamoeba nuttalli P19]|eukprot:XP_008859735.1 CDP-alcohol phosphatidyltransferase family protein [Entamoeba nuttalli P19]